MNELNADATLADVAFAVCTALDRAGEHAVLCGGSAATYYVPQAYQSRDLDFVLRFGARARDVDEALRPLGYHRMPERLYQHPTIPYTVEFPVGPLAIGSETVAEHATVRRGTLLLHVYTVTDVVRDRFMHFWAWGDQAALRVALAVAAEHPSAVDAAAIEAWTERELRNAPVYDRARRDHFLAELRRTIKR
jgi:hypothetical protein